MELRHLRYFVAVAETGNLSRAAEKLFIAQPPLSVQIRQLEEELGSVLFVRHAKGVRLTAAGEALLAEARALLDRAAHLKDHLRGDAAGSVLAVGYVPSASSTVLPELIRALRAQVPGLRIEPREMISSDQVEALAAGHLDVGIVRHLPRHPRLQATARMADPFCVVSPAEGTPPGAIDLAALAEHDFVGFTRHRGPAYFDLSIHLCAQAGFSPRMRCEASTVHGVLDLVGAGLGHALVPESAVLLGRESVVFRRICKPAQALPLALLRRKADDRVLLQRVDATVQEIFTHMALRIAASF